MVGTGAIRVSEKIPLLGHWLIEPRGRREIVGMKPTATPKVVPGASTSCDVGGVLTAVPLPAWVVYP